MRRYLLLLLLIAGCATRAPVLAPALERTQGPESIELTAVPFFPQRDYQCGPASLAAVLRYAGVDIDAEGLRPRVYLPGKQGSLALELAAAARSFGRIGYQPPPRLDALLAELQAGRPAVVLQNLGLAGYPLWHFAVVIGYSGGKDRFVLRSGEDRRMLAPAFAFMRTWALADQWALVILEPGQLPASDDPAGFLRAVAATEATTPAAPIVRAYEAAAARWPDNPIAHLGLANAVRRQGDSVRAIELYLDLIRRDPGQLAARNNLADALYAAGCASFALQTIEAALSEAPPAHPLRGVLEQTRAEILAHPAKEPALAQCQRWQSSATPQVTQNEGPT
jgi:tetratricopeptide (TPR) repeat protein